jgi:hypothetical protein
VLLVIGSLTAAGLVVNMLVWPVLAYATAGGVLPGDQRWSGVLTIAVVVLGALIHRSILRSEQRSAAG